MVHSSLLLSLHFIPPERSCLNRIIIITSNTNMWCVAIYAFCMNTGTDCFLASLLAVTDEGREK